VFLSLCRFALAAVFLYAVYAAVSSPIEFVSDISSLVARGRGAIVASIAILLIEIIAAILLIIPATARIGASWSIVLLLSFTVYPLYYLHVFGGGALKCACFGGIIASDRAVSTIVRNVVLLTMAALVGIFSRKGAKTQRKPS
jgi:hypothetical protein